MKTAITQTTAQAVSYTGMLWLPACQLLVMLPFTLYLPLWLIPVLIFSAGWRLRVLKGYTAQPGAPIKVLLLALGIAALSVSGLPFPSLDLMVSILLLGFAFPLWGVRVNDYPTTPDTVRVRVIGYQFGWLVHYPGPDGKFGETDLSKVSGATPDTQIGLSREGYGADDILRGDLTLPHGRPAIVQLSSKDVIHNYSIKAMRIAQDAIPGMEIPMWFTPIKEGTYDVVCAQLCGSGHAAMASQMTVVNNEKFVAEFEGGEESARVETATETVASLR